MKIILLNGPPGSGKDAAAQAIADRGVSIWITRMSMPMKLAFNAMMETKIDAIGNSPWEADKEKAIAYLGVSYRQWQIDFSEKFMKALYGNDIFVRLFRRRHAEFELANGPVSVIVVPDCGFEIEYNGLLHLYGNAVNLIRVHRPGFDYARDSRSYIGPEPPAPRVYDVQNDGTLQTYHARIFSVVHKILGEI